jgi:hypothetical protein
MDREEEMVRVLNQPEERIEMLARNGDPNVQTDDEDEEEEDVFDISRDRR